MGGIFSKSKQAINAIFASKENSQTSLGEENYKKNPMYDYMTIMYAWLKYPRNREIFFQNPEANKQLVALINCAAEFNKKIYQLTFKDYQTELEMILAEKRNRPMRLLQIMMESQKDIPQKTPHRPEFMYYLVDPQQYPEVSISSMQQTTVERQIIETPITPINDVLCFDEAIDSLCNHFAALTIEDENDDYHQEAKRQKESQEKSKYIHSMQMAESALFVILWDAKKEILEMNASLRNEPQRPLSEINKRNIAKVTYA